MISQLVLLVAAVLASAFLATTTAQVTGSYSVKVTATGSVDFAAATELASYPKCAAICDAQPNINCPSGDPKCLCEPDNRGNTTACEYLTCNDEEYQQTVDVLAPAACGPFYKADPALASSVSVALEAATAAARDTLNKVDPLDISTYPECGQKCLPPAIEAAGCNGLADRDCVCHCPIVNHTALPCELESCTNENYNDQFAYFMNTVTSLCAPVGGINPQKQSSCRVNQTVGTATSGSGGPTYSPSDSSPPIEPFKGDASAKGRQTVAVVLLTSLVIALEAGALVW